MTNKRTISIETKEIRNGISIKLDIAQGKEFHIEYPEDIWKKTPKSIRKVLLENLAFAETHFLPLLFGKKKVLYDTNYPIFEPVFFKNQILDMLDCEMDDGVQHLSYMKDFYNLEFEYRSLNSSYPSLSNIPSFETGTPCAIIPFSFGKESLVTFALCRELGIEPILVYSHEPSQPYEDEFKRKLLKKIGEKYNVQTYYLKHETGLFRYGKAFQLDLKTEVGWGAQTTLLSLLMIPFVFAHGAQYIFFGSEYLNNDVKEKEGWKVYLSADQTFEMSAVKNNMIRTITNNQCESKNTLEPLDEISIFFLLHHRYPDIGVFQFSCNAERPLHGDSQWCHECYKCCRMYLFAVLLNIDPAAIGFQKDLLNTPKTFDFYFEKGAEESYSLEEWDFAFYLLMKRNHKSAYVERFKRERLEKIHPISWYKDFFTKMKPSHTFPDAFEKQLKKIFTEELRAFQRAVE